MVNALKHQKELDHLRSEHRALESEISTFMKEKVVNTFALQDLKKRKLALKEQIAEIEEALLGDVVA